MNSSQNSFRTLIRHRLKLNRYRKRESANGFYVTLSFTVNAIFHNSERVHVHLACPQGRLTLVNYKNMSLLTSRISSWRLRWTNKHRIANVDLQCIYSTVQVKQTMYSACSETAKKSILYFMHHYCCYFDKSVHCDVDVTNVSTKARNGLH